LAARAHCWLMVNLSSTKIIMNMTVYFWADPEADLHSLVDPAIKTAVISEKLPVVLPYLPASSALLRKLLLLLACSRFHWEKTLSCCLGLPVPSAASIPVLLELLV